MDTLLINEQFVSQFKYWQEGQIRTGMQFRSDLFEYIEAFSHRQRHAAFDLAWRLTEAGREPIITASINRYIVWANLKVLAAQSPSDRASPSSETKLSASPSQLLEPAFSA
jgi:hypothetical protein